MDRCIRCTAANRESLYAVVELNVLLCGNCVDLWHEWCDMHKGEPYGNFIQPKPWEPSMPGLVRIVLDDGKTHTFVTPKLDADERLLWVIFSNLTFNACRFKEDVYRGADLDMTDETAFNDYPMPVETINGGTMWI